MPDLTNVLVDAAGRPIVGVEVSVELAGRWSADGVRETIPATVWTGVTDGTGRWTATLPPQSAYEGSTAYVVREPGARTYRVTLADAPSVQSLRSRIPPAALAPGVPGFSYVVGTDPRLSDARVPTAHALSHAVGGSDPITGVPAGGIALGSLTDVSTVGATVGQALVFGGTNWAPATVSGGGGGFTVLIYTGGAYPARPGVPAGWVRYLGPVAPTTWLTGDEWIDNS